MIQRSTAWQDSLRCAIFSPQELLQALDLSADLLPGALQSDKDFRLIVPREFVARMQTGNPNDPLLLQVLPLSQELEEHPGFTRDPLNEAAKNPIPGLLHKYHGRVLLTLSGSCAVNCRYCFRRHFTYEKNVRGRNGWQKMVDYIAQDATISEVIYSGGEPLLLTDDLLIELTEKIADIKHVKHLRIHTRLPIVIPVRVTSKLITFLKNSQLQTVIVLHCNHANEIDSHVSHALQKFVDTNIILLNQAVLLRGINDCLQTQINLNEKLFEVGVLPYYLHQLDPVKGAKHFLVDLKTGKQLYHAMQANLPGYLVPRFVQEIPGADSKLYV